MSNITALAYPLSDPTSLCACTLVLRHDEQRRQATILLKVTIPLHDLDGQHDFVAQYDADELKPGTTTLRPGTVSLSEAQQQKLARHAKPQMRTLSLSLHKPCKVWCPRLPSIAPKPDFEASYRQLVELVKATEVRVVFDNNWLHKYLRQRFERLFQGEAALTGYPVHEYYNDKCNLADWTVFRPAENIAADAVPSVDDAAPPAYESSSNKRLSRDSISPSSPPRKRLLLDDASQRFFLSSPTERAPSLSADEARHHLLSKEDHYEHDFQTEAISRAVERHLPSALEKLLPDLLPKLFTTPSPSFDSQPTPLTPLAQLLLPHLAAHLQPELQTLHADALASGQELRESADAELLDAVEEHKADLRLIKDDGVDTLQRAVTDAFETARVEGQEWAEELGDTTFEVVSGRLDGLSEKRLERALARVLKRWGVEGGWRGKRWQGGRWRRGRRGRYLGRKRGVT